jgi:hypothetical protein
VVVIHAVADVVNRVVVVDIIVDAFGVIVNVVIDVFLMVVG